MLQNTNNDDIQRTNHSVYSAGSLRTVEARRAPWMGGLEYIGLQFVFIVWEIYSVNCHAPDDDLQLRVHGLDLGITAAHNRERADTLACVM